MYLNAGQNLLFFVITEQIVYFADLEKPVTGSLTPYRYRYVNYLSFSMSSSMCTTIIYHITLHHNHFYILVQARRLYQTKYFSSRIMAYRQNILFPIR